MHQPDLSFASNGYLRVPDLLPGSACDGLAAQLAPLDASRGGTRCLLTHAWCTDLAGRLRIHPALAPLLPPDAVAVQCTHFEKSVDRNWLVPMHQDLAIPVAERVDDPALSGWSTKEGALFVHAPIALLEQLVAVRLHLDDCGPDDGPLRVVPGSHRFGRLEATDEQRLREATREVVCDAARGAVLAMRPLLLHASSKSSGSSRRRVLHVLFGPRRPGHGLSWHHAA